MSFVLPEGTVIDERFEILSLVGKGGIGTVYKAKQAGIERVVAIKFLQDSIVDDEENQERFKREGLALSLLRHPGIPIFYQFGFWLDRMPYIAMEFLEGKNLKSEILHNGRIPWQRSLLIAKQIASAMEHAHSKGIVHRDLKAENIVLLASEPEQSAVRVFDFGLARFSSSENPQKTLTETGLLIGSVNYMSPEQCRGAKADHRSDIYSLACIMFEMLTGQLPFQADLPIGIINKHISEPVPGMTQSLSLPAGLEATIRKGMSKNAAGRHQSMTELISCLELIEQGRGNEILEQAQPGSPSSNVAIIAAVALAIFGLSFFGFSYQNKAKTSEKDIAVAKIGTRAKKSGLRSITGHDPEAERQASLLAEEHNYPAARALMLQKIDYYKSRGMYRDADARRLSLAEFSRQAGNLEQAFADLAEVGKHDQDDHQFHAMILHGRGTNYIHRWRRDGKLQDLKAAEKSFLEEQAHWKQTDSDADIKRVGIDLALCQMFLNKDAEARENLHKAFPYLEKGLDEIRASDKQFYLDYFIASAFLYLKEGNQALAVREFRALKAIQKATYKDGSRLVQFLVIGYPPGYGEAVLQLSEKSAQVCMMAEPANYDVLVPLSVMTAEILMRRKDQLTKDLVHRTLERIPKCKSIFSAQDFAFLQLKGVVMAVQIGECKIAEELMKSSEKQLRKSGPDRLMESLFWRGLTYEGMLKFEEAEKALNELCTALGAGKKEPRNPELLADGYGHLQKVHYELWKQAKKNHDEKSAEFHAIEGSKCFETQCKAILDYPQVRDSVAATCLTMRARILFEEAGAEGLHALHQQMMPLLKARYMNTEFCFPYFVQLVVISNDLLSLKKLDMAESVLMDAIDVLTQCKFTDGNHTSDAYRKLGSIKRVKSLELAAKKDMIAAEKLRLESNIFFDKCLEVAAKNIETLQPDYAGAICTEYGDNCLSSIRFQEFAGRNDYALSIACRALSNDQLNLAMYQYVEFVHKVRAKDITPSARAELLKNIDLDCALLRSNKDELTIWPSQLCRLLIVAKMLSYDEKVSALLAAAKQRAARASDSWNYRYANRLRELGEHLTSDGDFANAKFFLDLSMDAYKHVPQTSQYAWQIVQTEWILARLRERENKREESAQLRRRVLAKLEKLRAIPAAKLQELDCLVDMKNFCDRCSDPIEAKKYHDAALDLAKSITAKEQIEHRDLALSLLK